MSKTLKINDRCGKLTILNIWNEYDSSGHSRKIAYCKCDCGKEKYFYYYNLTSGRTTSCGCYQKELLIERNKNGKVITS